MAKQIINIGTAPNSRNGDPLRTAFNKVNQNFTELYNGQGAGNTGDVTFSGVKVIGAGTASGDGFGYSTLELVPDNNLYNITGAGEGSFGSGGQYLIIDPTSPNHIHVRAGGPQDQAAAQLIWGGEKANVTVRDQDNSFNENHAVVINTQSNDAMSLYAWQFKNTGDLELPTNGGIVFDRANTSIRVGMGFHIASGEGIDIQAIDETDPQNLIYKSWYFSPTGNMQFPDSTVQTTAWAGGRVVGVPTLSIGADGDKLGDIAFNGSYIYYCTQNFIAASYSSTIVGTYSGSFPSIVKGSIPQPQAGWVLIHNGDTYTLDSNATEGNPGEWTCPLATSISVTVGDTVTVGPGSAANIWKRTAWSGDTW